MSFTFTEYGGGLDVYLLLGVGFEIGVPDISGLGLAVVMFRKECKYSDTSERYDA